MKRQSMILVYLFITTHTLDWSIHVYDEACTHKQIYQELKCPTSWDQWRCNSAVVRAGLSLFLSPIRTRNKVNMSSDDPRPQWPITWSPGRNKTLACLCYFFIELYIVLFWWGARVTCCFYTHCHPSLLSPQNTFISYSIRH